MKKLNALIIGSHNQVELMDSICSNVKSTQFTAIFVDNLDLSFELFQQTANLMQSVDFIVMVILINKFKIPHVPNVGILL